jgi:peptidoglycan hydrolase-like protein with peptidoglycan-binding domain
MRIGHANLAIVAAFVLVFVGLGTWFVSRSQASSICVYQTYSQGSSGTCVKAIQSIVDGSRVGVILKTCPYGGLSYTCSGGYYDGIFGPKTTYGVKRFQYYFGLRQDGIVGPATWAKLCRNAGNNDYNRAGCYALSSGGGI